MGMFSFAVNFPLLKFSFIEIFLLFDDVFVDVMLSSYRLMAVNGGCFLVLNWQV